MDPLSDVLSLLKPRSYMSGGWDMGGAWSVKFGPHDGIKCYALVSGQCWLVVEGIPEPVRVVAGDCFVLPRGWPFRLTNDLALTPVDFRATVGAPLNGSAVTIQGGGDCFGVGEHFAFEGGQASILLSVLPPIVHIRREPDKATMRWSLERMMEELAQMMLVLALRLHLAEGLRGGVGWLFALADEQMRSAMTAMHDDPAHRWTLQELAESAGMSRSTFALKFKETVGTSPMEYLTRWRILLAGDKLTSSSDPVSVIARSLGYESESAFSTAFKRVMGCSPRQYDRVPEPTSPDAAGATRTNQLEAVAD
jgi:AraC-like DNA-binding protein